MSVDQSISQIVLGEEKNGRGIVGDIVLDAELVPGVRFTKTGLEITDASLQIDTWLRIGRMLGHVHRTINWWIGDWINKGEALFGHEASQGVEGTVSDRYNEAERITSLDHQTLLNISSICANVARSRRRSELGFWIHQEVARLEPDEQKRWLKEAVDNNWSGRELRENLNQAGLRPGRKQLSEGGDTDVSSERANGAGSGSHDHRSDEQRIEQAARRVYHQGVVRNGEAHVPIEAWSQLEAALGD